MSPPNRHDMDRAGIPPNLAAKLQDDIALSPHIGADAWWGVLRRLAAFLTATHATTTVH